MLTEEQKRKILSDPIFQNFKPATTSRTSIRSRIEARRNKKEESGFIVSFVDRLKSRVKDVLDEGQELKIKEEEGKINNITKTLSEGGLGAKLVAETGYDFVFNGLSRMAEKISGVEDGKEKTKSLVEKKAKEFFETESGKVVMNVLQKGQDVWTEFEKEHPNLAENAKAISRIAEAYPPVKGATATYKGTKELAGVTGRAVKETAEKVGETAMKSKNIFQKGYDKISSKISELTEKNPFVVISEKLGHKEGTLEEIVSPKFLSSEKAKAIKEGRVTQGADYPGVGKAPDVIEPSKQAKEIADTFRKYVDDADKLDQFQIVKQADETIKSLSKEIKPKLKEIQFSPSQRRELFDEWEWLKNQQQKSVFFDTKASVKRFQDTTETFLKQVNQKLQGADGQFREWTMSDLWDFRIAYDNLDDVKRIKKLLKKADLTGEEQLLVDMWLQNRNMLNQFIKDAAKEMGEDVGTKWSDMSNLYDIIDNISLKGDIDLKGEPNTIMKFLSIPTRITR